MDARTKKILVIVGAVVVPGGLILGGLLWYRSRRTMTPWMAGLVVGAGGENPAAELATAAGVGLNQYALARMMQSEGRAEADRIARAWVAINDARATTGGNVYRVITLRKAWHHVGAGGKVETHERAGFFGEQSAGGRYATTKEPSSAVIALAGRVLKGEIPDPTHGATRFVDTKAFGHQPGTRTFAEVDAKWRAEGFRPRAVPGADPSFLVYSKVG